MRLVCLLVVLLVAPSARADTLEATFTRANRAFARGDHAAAIADYDALLEAGVDDPDVSFNLASAHGALGHYGQAIRFFERSLRLRPGDDDARAALKRAREALGQRQALESGEAIVADRPPLTEALFGSVTRDALAVTVLVGVWLLAIAAALLLYVRAEALRLSLGIATVLGGLVALTAGLGLAVKADGGSDGTRAIVLGERAPMREGPDDLARLAQELAEGSEVRVLAREGGFVRVRRGERQGYMRSADVGEI